jgi:integrase
MKYLTVAELAERWKCSPGHIYNLVNEEKLIPVKLTGRKIVFPLDKIKNYERRREERKYEIKDLGLDSSSSFNAKMKVKGDNTMGRKGSRYWGLGNGCSILMEWTRKGTLRFKIRYYDAGGIKRDRTAKGATNFDEAYACLQQKLQDVVEQKNLQHRRKHNISFRDYAEDFKSIRMKTERRNWKSDSYRLNIAVDYFGDIPLKEITPNDILMFKQERIDLRNGPGTVNRYLALLKRMFNVAIQSGHVEKNPVKQVRFESEQNQIVEWILTNAEEQRLLAECSERLKPLVVLALHTGMRKSELLNLEWKNVDFNKKMILVEHTKSGKARRIPMNEVAEAELLVLKSRNGTERVFPFTSIRSAWEGARRGAGLQGLRFHDLRHTFGSRLAERGVDLVRIRKLMGHSTLLVTQRYLHSSDVGLRNAVAQLDTQQNSEVFGPQDWSTENEQLKEPLYIQ